MLVLALVTVSMAVLLRYMASWQDETLTFTPAHPRVEQQMALTRLTDVLLGVALSLVPDLLLGGFTVLVVGLLLRRSATLRQGIRSLLSLSGPVLLAAAHLLAVRTLISFGARVEAYPLHIVGLMVYAVATALSGAALGIQIRRMGCTDVDAASLLLISVPAFASLVLRAGLWLGGAPCAPYDPGDTDIFGSDGNCSAGRHPGCLVESPPVQTCTRSGRRRCVSWQSGLISLPAALGYSELWLGTVYRTMGKQSQSP